MKRNILATALLLCLYSLLTLMLSPTAHAQTIGATATPSNGLAPLTVNFNAYPGANTIYYTWQFYQWDFGDGNTSTDLPATHVYTTAGTYQPTAYFYQNCLSRFCPPAELTPFSTTVTVTPFVITSVSLTPATLSLMVGDGSTTLHLTDQNNSIISGAFWSTDNSSVLSLSTDDPPIIAALAPGTAHIIASANGLSAQTTVTVYPYGSGHHFPLGTVLWSVPVPARLTFRQMLKMAPAQGTAAFVGLENDSSNNTVLRGITSDGQQMWQTMLNQYVTPVGNQSGTCCTTVADDSGGVIGLSQSSNTVGYVNSLTRVDGATGLMAWRYDSPPDLYSSVTLYGGFASQGGTIVAVQTQQDTPGGNDPTSHSYLVLLDSQTGTIMQSTLLPTGHDNIEDPVGYDNGAQPGPVTISPDGTVNVETTTVNYQLFSDGTEIETRTLYFTAWHPDGTVTTQQLQQSTAQCTGNCHPDEAVYSPEEAIPDGQGGSLIAWKVYVGNNNNSTTHVTHIDSTGALLDYALPLHNTSGLGEVVLGENGTAFVSDGIGLVAFNVNSGAVLWGPWNGSTSADTLYLVAAEWGGGVLALDQSQGTQNMVRFDGQGNTASWDATGLNPDFSPIFGMWYGYNGSSYEQVELAQIIPSSESPCGFPRCYHFPTDDTPGPMQINQRTYSPRPAQVPGCAKTKTYKGQALPQQVLATDPSSVPTGLAAWLTTARTKVDNSALLTTAGNACATFWSDPKRAPYYSQVQNAVDNQVWYDGPLSIISEYDAGLWEMSDLPASQWKAILDNSPTPWVSCDFAKDIGLVAKSAAHDTGLSLPGTDTYYTDRAEMLQYILPATIVHESLHNLTGKTDGEVRIMLDIPAPKNDKSTFDITQKIEDVGCAPKP